MSKVNLEFLQVSQKKIYNRYITRYDTRIMGVNEINQNVVQT